jgi:hypothetical protein
MGIRARFLALTLTLALSFWGSRRHPILLLTYYFVKGKRELGKWEFVHDSSLSLSLSLCLSGALEGTLSHFLLPTCKNGFFALAVFGKKIGTGF